MASKQYFQPLQFNQTLYLYSLQRSELLELRLELPLGGVEAQPEHTDTLAGLRLLPVADVAPPAGHGGPGVLLPPAASLHITLLQLILLRDHVILSLSTHLDIPGPGARP